MPTAERWRDWAVIGRFAALHLSVLSVFLVPFAWSLPAWLAGSYVVRMFGVTAGYHRYFSHRSYKSGACIAVRDGRPRADARRKRACSGGRRTIATTTALRSARRTCIRRASKGSGGRTGVDHVAPATTSTSSAASPISAVIRSCAGSIGITGCRRSAFGVLVFAVGGLSAFVWGYLLATVVLYHATFAINSVAAHLGDAPLRDWR